MSQVVYPKYQSNSCFAFSFMTIPFLEFWVPTITIICTKEENRPVKIVEELLVCLNLSFLVDYGVPHAAICCIVVLVLPVWGLFRFFFEGGEWWVVFIKKKKILFKEKKKFLFWYQVVAIYLEMMAQEKPSEICV